MAANERVQLENEQRDEIKGRHPEVVLLFRAADGDYDPHPSDLAIVRTVTGADRVPYDGAEAPVKLLIDAGHKVAICERLGGA